MFIATLHCRRLLRAACRPAFHLQTGVRPHCRPACRELFHYRNHCHGNLSFHSGHLWMFCYLWPLAVNFADCLVKDLGWELSVRFGRFVSASDLVGTLWAHRGTERIKSCFFPPLQRTCWFMDDREWMCISRIQKNYLQFSVSSQTSSMISVQQPLSLASVLTYVIPRSVIQRNKCVCAEVLHQTPNGQRGSTEREGSWDKFKRSLAHIRM